MFQTTYSLFEYDKKRVIVCLTRGVIVLIMAADVRHATRAEFE
jgi:hypothetical protein